MNDKPQKFKCPECSKEFDNIKAIGPHRRIAHGYVAKPPSKNAGANHVAAAKKHAGSFPCPHCDFVASWSGGLTKHIRASHREVEPPPLMKKIPKPTSGPHQCPDCERSFKALTGLGIHRRSAHGVLGMAPTSVRQRELNKEKQLAQGTQNAITIAATNGHVQVQTQDDGSHRLEAIATLACGRIQQVIEGLAFTHDLPPRTLTSYVIRTLGQAAKVW